MSLNTQNQYSVFQNQEKNWLTILKINFTEQNFNRLIDVKPH